MTRASRARRPGAGLALGLALLVGAPAPGPAQDGVRGLVQGRVMVLGPVPTPGSLKSASAWATASAPLAPVPSPGPDSCDPGLPDVLEVGPDRGLAACVAVLDERPTGKSPTTTPAPVVLDQKGCRFVPHVVAVGRARPLLIRSSDPVIHNAHAFTVAGRRERFNLGFPAGGGEREVRETLPGALAVRCDAGHPWMSAFVYVAPGDVHAVTGGDGSFALEGIPPGKRRVTLWHELLGSLPLLVEVRAGAPSRIEVETSFFPAPAWGEVRGALRLGP